MSSKQIYSSPAPVGLQEMNSTRNLLCVKYLDSENSCFEYFEFPGYSFGLAEEFNKNFIENNKCDIYLIVYESKLTKDILDLAQIIKKKYNSSIYLIRNKADIEFRNKKNKYIGYSEEGINKIMIEELESDIIGKLGSLDDDELKYKLISNFFLVSSTKENIENFQIRCLKETLKSTIEIKSFHDSLSYNISISKSNDKEKRNEIFLLQAKQYVHKIKNELEKRINLLAILSAITDIIPIGGTVFDVAILIAELANYRSKFGLTLSCLESFQTEFKIPLSVKKNIAQKVGIDSKYLNLNILIYSLIGATSIGIQIAYQTAQSISYAFNVLTLGFGFLLSAAITGPISFILCKEVLKKALIEMEKDSIKMIELIYDAIKEK